jgi:hypothetical protein
MSKRKRAKSAATSRSETDDIETINTIKGSLDTIISHNAVKDLRFKESRFNDRNSTDDIESFVRHLLFLYRTGRIQGLDFAPRRFLKSALLHYTLPSEGVSIDPDPNYSAWRKLVLTAVNRLESSTIKSLRKDVPREYFVWYWQGLKGVNLQAVILNYKFAKQKQIPLHRHPGQRRQTNYILIPPAISETTTTYDDYLRDLLTRLHLKSETYDIVLLDCNSISEYRNKGIIEGFTDIFGAGEPSQGEISQHFRVGATRNGTIDALPVTRNFHLPAAHESFFHPTREQSVEGIRNIVRDFLGKGLSSVRGDANFLIASSMKEKIYLHYWGLQTESAQEHIAKLLKLESDVAISKDSNAFSGVLSHCEQNKGKQQSRPMLCPFSVTLEADLPFIPMQLARGPHAAYTFMALTANGIIDANELHQSFVSISKHKDDDVGDDGTRSLDIYSPQVLKARLVNVLDLIFNFVPDAALCLDHHFSALFRQSLSTQWFDPCLPIEAVGFQKDKNYIDVLPDPARFGERKYLNCFGGFCFGVSAATQDPGDVAEVVIGLARSLSTDPAPKGSEARPSVEEPRKRLMSYDIALPLADYYEAGLLKLAESEDGAPPKDEAGRVLEEKSADLLATPKSGAVRPNFELWPQIEAEISDTFRLYVAALFIYRAVHMEVSALRTTAPRTSIENVLFTRAMSERDVQETDHRQAMLWFLGAAESSRHATGERAALEVLKPSDVRAYLSNLGTLMDKLVDRSDSQYIEKGYDLHAVVENNIGPLVVDSDYVLGILRDCVDRTERSKISLLKLDDLEIAKDPDVRTKREEFLIKHFEPLRVMMVEALAESLAETVIRKIKSNCHAHGWHIELVGA